MILNRIVKYKKEFAISNQFTEITYGCLINDVKNLIELIKKKKINSKDLIAVEIEDSYFYIVAALACIEGGYSFLPINFKSTYLEKKKFLVIVNLN